MHGHCFDFVVLAVIPAVSAPETGWTLSLAFV
jgi:hypothetical protein